MSAAKAQLRARLAEELRLADQARAASDDIGEWSCLERAHVLSQPLVFPHVRVHGRMLGYALRYRDRREVVGQLVRLTVAGPASLLGRYPAGNPGSAVVPMTWRVPIPDDLWPYLEAVRVGR